jgi:thiol-disulfide isomerase/thioredoxin
MPPANQAERRNRAAMNKALSGLQLQESRGGVKRMRRAIAAAGLAIACVVAGSLIWARLQSANPQSQVRRDRPLPPLVVDSAGAAVDLSTFASGAGRVIVFYSPSCSVCKEVLPALQPFPANLRLIMVKETSDPDDLDLSSLPAAALFQDRWHVLSRAFAAVALPTLLFVDDGGVLRDGLVGRHERIFVQQKLKEFAIQSCGRASRQP